MNAAFFYKPISIWLVKFSFKRPKICFYLATLATLCTLCMPFLLTSLAPPSPSVPSANQLPLCFPSILIEVIRHTQDSPPYFFSPAPHALVSLISFPLQSQFLSSLFLRVRPNMKLILLQPQGHFSHCSAHKTTVC